MLSETQCLVPCCILLYCISLHRPASHLNRVVVVSVARLFGAYTNKSENQGVRIRFVHGTALHDRNFFCATTENASSSRLFFFSLSTSRPCCWCDPEFRSNPGCERSTLISGLCLVRRCVARLWIASFFAVGCEKVAYRTVMSHVGTHKENELVYGDERRRQSRPPTQHGPPS